MITTVVAGGALSLAGLAGGAWADSAADGAAAGSPGLVSGNLVQLPVHVPVNVCGNTVSVAGLLNPAAGNTCTNEDGRARPGKPGGGHDGGGEGEDVLVRGSGKDSPGILSGNSVQLPVKVPVNVSGNSVNVVGIGNASTGNTSVNGPGPVRSGPKPPQPPVTRPVAPTPRPVAQPPRPGGPGLAHTGTEALGYLAPAGAGLLLGGALLYRRFRTAP
ncbi:chaplin [Streptomyces sp. NPDC086023]|uniref:chaplin n=1 Tax=Streptomyces sp. NPDC086023 TaxID=3365746 RepID=UPI0037D7560E